MQVLPISVDAPETAQDNRDSYRRLKSLRRPDLLFLLVVIGPVLASIIYFGFLAADIYISESRFVVRAPEKRSASGLGAILQTAGFANASEEVSAAQSYAVSRDALRAINRNGAFEKAYSSPEVSFVDRFDPLGMWGSFEELYRYFQGKVMLQNDSATSITTLTVKAYTPEDARRFNEQLLQLSEATVNRLNLRGRQDLVRFAQAEVDNTKVKAQSAAIALAAYRNRSGVVDPDKQAEVQMQMISNLQNQLIAAKTELAQLQRYAPENPRVPVIRTQIAAIQSEMGRETGKITGGQSSLAGNAVQFQRLTLENEFAAKQLAAALASLEEAQNEARRKQAYVERIVQPNLPDAPMEPRRMRGILATIILSLLAYGILRMLLAGVREHAQ
jgi:capsular polysaccharide transport system permease protein